MKLMRSTKSLALSLPRRLRIALGVPARGNDTFSSFRTYLPGVLQWLDPADALEFGPGLSSSLILENSDARLLSFQTGPSPPERARPATMHERIDLRLCPGPTDFSELAGRAFDVVFVDGGDRVANLLGSRPLLREAGITVLHDAHRESYLPGVRAYDHGYFIENHSLLLFKSRSRFHELRALFPPDDQCQCHYCGTPERIQYRKRVAAELAESD